MTRPSFRALFTFTLILRGIPFEIRQEFDRYGSPTTCSAETSYWPCWKVTGETYDAMRQLVDEALDRAEGGPPAVALQPAPKNPRRIPAGTGRKIPAAASLRAAAGERPKSQKGSPPK